MKMWRSLLEPLASLRLTVALLAAAMVLIFAGTLAQVNQGVWQTIDSYFRSPIAWIDLQLFLPRQIARMPGSFPFPGGLLIAGLMIVNLLAAHALRFKLSAKRTGIILLHAGVVLLLVGEFVTAFASEEGMMPIDEGGSANYVEDIRTAELAIVDRSDPQQDRVVAIPQAMLVAASRTGERITHPDLPVSVTVERWMNNARLEGARSETFATRGIGTQAVALPLPNVRGVDGGQTDAPAAYITLHRAGSAEPIGTWLTSVNLARPQPIDALSEQGAFDLALRFERTYKPYTLHLIDFRHDKFVGTEIPRNFSSRVRVVDPTRGTDREVVISMNNPLRYAGEAFYQASFMPGDTGTVLQVVNNPGWLIPYLACLLVAAGMTLHFVLGLWGFLGRTRRREAKAPAPQPGLLQRSLPWAAAVLGLLIALSGLMRPAPGGGVYDLETFGSLPVSSGGRVKPMDTVARNALMLAGGRQQITPDDGDPIPATRFVLDLLARPTEIRNLPVVRVDHPDVLALLDRTVEQGGRLPLSAIEPYWGVVTQQAMRASQVQSKQRDLFQRSVLELHQKVNHLLMLSHMREPYAVPPLSEGEQWRPFHEALLASGLVQPMGEDSGAEPAPPHPGVAWWTAMMTAWHNQDADAFNRHVAEYHRLVASALPGETRRAGFEVLFNRAAPFYGATVVYVFALMLLLVALLLRMRATGNASETLRRLAVGLLWAAAIVHTLGIATRIGLQGRPPVTNLYSSAIFVGWAAVLLGLLLERLFPLMIAALGAATVGFATLVIAHNLGNDGDTMQMMQAVLDSNFWLATHVITITLGYSATFLAGVLGAGYLLLGVFTRFLTADRAKSLAKMVYGTVCFALLLSFVGTVLGGIWADQSWGRFWGWDPKENGAALVVLINAIILHARWGGLVRNRGIMVLAVAGNIVTAWSWFGTNMLGVGLHAYGFIDSAVFWLIAFVLSQLLVMALGLLPREAWRSTAA